MIEELYYGATSRVNRANKSINPDKKTIKTPNKNITLELQRKNINEKQAFYLSIKQGDSRGAHVPWATRGRKNCEGRKHERTPQSESGDEKTSPPRQNGDVLLCNIYGEQLCQLQTLAVDQYPGQTGARFQGSKDEGPSVTLTFGTL